MRSNQARLNTGNVVPLLGLGTFSISYDTIETNQAIKMALKMGYRHFDTAKIYGSESILGQALKEAINEGMVNRDELFVTSKLWSSDHHDPVAALQQSLRNMGMEYLDLYMVHWPIRFKSCAEYPVPNEDDFEELDMKSTWANMEKCLELGLCKAIGVSNFSTKKLENLLHFASIPPAVNQIEMHPMWRQNKMRQFCKEHNIHVSAYMPLGGPGNFWGSTWVIQDPIIQSIAKKYQVTPAQFVVVLSEYLFGCASSKITSSDTGLSFGFITTFHIIVVRVVFWWCDFDWATAYCSYINGRVALRWGMQKGASVMVKSFNENRMKENLGALEVELDDDDMINIEKMVERKIMRGDHLVNKTTSPYKTVEDLWDNEI